LALAAVALIPDTTVSSAQERRRGRVRVDLTDDELQPLVDVRTGRRQRVPLVRDFSSAQVIFPEVVDEEIAGRVRRDARFRQQYLRRHARRLARRNAERAENNGSGEAVVRDWSFSLNTGNGGTISAPAKYVFDITAAPSCANDFVVTGVNVAGSATQANLIGFNSLYNMPAGNGLCPGTAPNVLFAYNIGPGTINSYVALSLDGTKVAFSESGGSPRFHVLRWRTGAGNGTSASAPATPGVGNTAVDTALALSGTSSTAPFIDYANDTAYVTTNDGLVHKFSGVFNGTLAEVLTGGWPVSTSGLSLSTPVYDGVSERVFFTDGQGRLHYVDDSVVPAVWSPTPWAFASNGIVPGPVVVDSGNQKVYAFSGNPNGTNAVVAQADTSLSVASRVIANVGLNSSNVNPRQGDFNEDYYNGVSASARLYVVGNSSNANRVPALFALSFNASFRLNTAPANGPLALATNNAGISASPVTAFYNSTLNRQFIFVGVTNRCSATVTTGCIRSLNVTGGAFPTAANLNNVILAASGGTGGITVDNNSGATGAASVYYTTLSGQTIVKATQANLQ
jgi:hypothetical protein